MRHDWRIEHAQDSLALHLGLNLRLSLSIELLVHKVHRICLNDCVTTCSAPVLGRNVPGLVLEINAPIGTLGHELRVFYLCVDEVEPDTPLTRSTRSLAILTYWHALVALQMALSTCQTSCPHSLWLCCRGRFCGWCRAIVLLI